MNSLLFGKLLRAVFIITMMVEGTDLSNGIPFVTQETTPAFPVKMSTTRGISPWFSHPQVFFPEFVTFMPDILLDDASYGNEFTFDVHSPVKTMKSFCHISQSCKTDQPKRTNEEGGICCLPCDCSPRCYATGTCCLDMTNGSLYRQHPDSLFASMGETCVKTFILGVEFKSNIFLASSYMLHQNCTDVTDNQTIEKCLYPNVFELEEMNPVFSQKTNRHYRNIFCSKCSNDSKNLVWWPTQIECYKTSFGLPILPNVENITIVDFLSINPNCALLWLPAANTRKADHCLHENDIVSDCNNPTLDTVCKQYYAPVNAEGIIYKNVFCLECANPSSMTGRYGECFPIEFDFPGFPLVSKLFMRADQKGSLKPDISEFNNCAFPRKYNNELDACIHHTCAVTKLSVGNICKPIFSFFYGTHLEYRLKIIFPASSIDILMSLTQIAFDSNIKTVINSSVSRICATKILELNKSGEFFEARVALITAADLPVTNIEQSYNEYVKNIETYNEMVKEFKSAYVLQIDKSNIEPVIQDVVTFATFDSFNFSKNCPNAIAISKLQFCDTITFHEDEFKIHGNVNISVGNLMFGPGDFIPRLSRKGKIAHIQVCLDDYISAYMEYDKRFEISVAVQVHVESRGILILFVRLFCLLSHIGLFR